MLESSEKVLQRKLIFNPEGEREAANRKVIKGNPTNIIELNNIKYPWAFDLYKTMGFSNFWIPEEIPLMEDKKQYERVLSDYERRAYELVLSFLIALDSFQVDMLKDFARMISAPEIEMALTAQEFQESVHAYSYQFILESVVDPIKADEIYNYWREDEKLRERNEVVAEVYNEFIRKPSEENFIKAVIGNYILESLYFYSGFHRPADKVHKQGRAHPRDPLQEHDTQPPERTTRAVRTGDKELDKGVLQVRNRPGDPVGTVRNPRPDTRYKQPAHRQVHQVSRKPQNNPDRF